MEGRGERGGEGGGEGEGENARNGGIIVSPHGWQLYTECTCTHTPCIIIM